MKRHCCPSVRPFTGHTSRHMPHVVRFSGNRTSRQYFVTEILFVVNLHWSSVDVVVALDMVVVVECVFSFPFCPRHVEFLVPFLFRHQPVPPQNHQKQHHHQSSLYLFLHASHWRVPHPQWGDQCRRHVRASSVDEACWSYTRDVTRIIFGRVASISWFSFLVALFLFSLNFHANHSDRP